MAFTKKTTTKKTTAAKKTTADTKPSICDKIVQKRQTIADQEQLQRNQDAKAFKATIKHIRAFLPQLREARQIYDTLKDNGFITMLEESMYIDREEHYKKGYFLSDGWYHWPGFSAHSADMFLTRGGGVCRFSCGITLSTGTVMISTGEFSDPNQAISDASMVEMLKKGGDNWTMHNDGVQVGYHFSGMEILKKLQYCERNMEHFVEAVRAYAEQVVNK